MTHSPAALSRASWCLAWVLAAGPGFAAPPLPSFGEADYTLSAWIRTTDGGVICSKSSVGGPWACNGKTFFVHGGRLGFDFGCIGVYGANNRAAFSFLKIADDMERLCQDLQAQVSRDYPGYDVDNLYS